MANLRLFAKAGLAVLVIVSIGILIERLTEKRHWWGSNVPVVEVQVINVSLSPTVDITDNIYNENFTRCLKDHSKASYFPINQFKNTSSCQSSPGQCIYNTLIDFSKLMESLDMDLWLIEPTLLFCFLSPSQKYNLLTRGFSPAKVQKSKNVITLGILQNKAELLDKVSTRRKFISAGFRISRFSKWVTSQQLNEVKTEIAHEALQYFFIRDDILMHVIVFYSRGTYLWYPGLSVNNMNVKGLLFVNDGAFENFTVSSVFLETLSSTKVFLPTDSRCFLLDMLSSKFVKCKIQSPNTVSSISHSSVSKDEINKSEYFGIKELKTVLNSQMIIFWLWEKTLRGWYETCNIMHYSSELNIAVEMKNVKGYNISALLSGSECLKTEEDSVMRADSKIEVRCQGLPVNIFLMSETKDIFWHDYSDGQNTYRLTFPKFTLCSTDIFGLKINVPCETSEILGSQQNKTLKMTIGV